jgi:hypothetical protein
MKRINPLSMLLDTEFIGLVNHNADGTWTPTKRVMGTSSGATLPTTNPTTTAYYHTHGAYNIRYSSEVFSTSPGDIYVATANGIDAYVMTPGQKIRYYDVKTGTQTRLK